MNENSEWYSFWHPYAFHAYIQHSYFFQNIPMMYTELLLATMRFYCLTSRIFSVSFLSYAQIFTHAHYRNPVECVYPVDVHYTYTQKLIQFSWVLEIFACSMGEIQLLRCWTFLLNNSRNAHSKRNFFSFLFHGFPYFVNLPYSVFCCLYRIEDGITKHDCLTMMFLLIYFGIDVTTNKMFWIASCLFTGSGNRVHRIEGELFLMVAIRIKT